MKKLSLLLAAALVLSLFAGCAGTPVIYYTDCTCPVGSHDPQPTQKPAQTPSEEAEGALKTGLAILASAGKSVSAGEKDGEAAFDVTLAAVLVDEEGIIRDCKLDSIGASLVFNTAGAIVTDLSAPILTKNELGDSYNMKAWGGAIAEWYEQAAALAAFAVGKTAEELKNGAVDESGYAPEGSDLASSATIYLAGYVDAIVKAVENAQHLGAQAGDVLSLAAIGTLGSSVAAGEKDGTAQLDVDVTALTLKGDTITSCAIDSLQAKVAFSAAGAIVTDLSAPMLTKNELGDGYNMKAWGGAIAEWYEQAASFAAYVTGKTAEDVLGIAVNEGTKPTDADLTASVTIAIGGFQKLIAKAAGK